MPLRGSYLSISRQVEALARRAQTLPGLGCPTCWGWPQVAVVDATGDGWLGDAPGPADAADAADAADDPRRTIPGRTGPLLIFSDWPDGLVCPACGREPDTVIRIEYAAAPPDVHLPGYLPGWRPGDTS